MTDLEISKALALAIGWEPFRIFDKGMRIVIVTGNWQAQEFDYRDWNVIGPIAEKYKAFPKWMFYRGAWLVDYVSSSEVISQVNVVADTPQKAIALAVIQGAKK